MEDPSLDRQHHQIRGHGFDLSGQPVDHDGVIVDGLAADAVIVSPAHQFPTGAVLSGPRRRELLAWSRATAGLIIEDDYDSEFRYDREPVRALQGLHPDGVIYIGTTSKTLAPALRLGWLIAPDRLIDELAEIKVLLDDFSPTLEQAAFTRLLARGHYQRQIRKTRGSIAPAETPSSPPSPIACPTSASPALPPGSTSHFTFRPTATIGRSRRRRWPTAYASRR